MSVNGATDGPVERRCLPLGTARGGSLRLVHELHPAFDAQQAFAEDAARVLRRSGASGQRSAIALHLVLRQHLAMPSVDPELGIHLSCIECRPEGRSVQEQYPCPTAQQALWALDALLD